MKFIKIIVVLAVIALLAAGCGRNDAQQNTVNNKKLLILTSFYPMYVSTLNVADNVPGVQVVNMTKPQTGCLHDYQLTPADMKNIEKADIFVVNGAGMEAFVAKAVQSHPGLQIIDASAGIKLLKDKSGEDNPHVWVSITDNIEQVKNIAVQLEKDDPDHAAQYQANAARYIQKLEMLRNEMHKKLDLVKKHEIVTFHEAFPYFAKEFNLNCVMVIEREPGSMPTPSELAETVKDIRAAGVTALFAEPQYSDEAARVIARETGAKVYLLDPVVTGKTGEAAKDAYLQAMRKNMEVLAEALK